MSRLISLGETFCSTNSQRMRCKVVDSHHCWSFRDRGNIRTYLPFKRLTLADDGGNYFRYFMIKLKEKKKK